MLVQCANLFKVAVGLSLVYRKVGMHNLVAAKTVQSISSPDIV